VDSHENWKYHSVSILNKIEFIAEKFEEEYAMLKFKLINVIALLLLIVIVVFYVLRYNAKRRHWRRTKLKL